jgi:hypothetical protein
MKSALTQCLKGFKSLGKKRDANIILNNILYMKSHILIFITYNYCELNLIFDISIFVTAKCKVGHHLCPYPRTLVIHFAL